jgi:hypothetical protein
MQTMFRNPKKVLSIPFYCNAQEIISHLQIFEVLSNLVNGKVFFSEKAQQMETYLHLIALFLYK